MALSIRGGTDYRLIAGQILLPGLGPGRGPRLEYEGINLKIGVYPSATTLESRVS